MGRRGRAVNPGKKPPLTTRKIEGRDVEIFVNDDGEFVAHGPEGEPVSAKSLGDLVSRLKKKFRELVSINVPATRIRRDYWNDEKVEFEAIAIIGTRGDNRFLIIDSDGDQDNIYDGSDVYARLTPADQGDYIRLVAEKKAAEKALEDWEEAHRLNVKQEIERAAKKADEEFAAARDQKQEDPRV